MLSLKKKKICKNYYFCFTDQIDCDSDPCKMAWLIRDNRQLLPAVINGQCSNGIAFNAIDQSSLANCAV